MKKSLLALSCAALLLGGCRAARTNAAAPSAEPAPAPGGEIVLGADSPQLKRIHTEPAVMVEYAAEEVVAPGRVEVNPNRVSRVLAPIAGHVRQVLAGLGDAVSEGQVLAVLESAEAGAAYAAQTQAQAEFRQARSALAKAEKDLARVRDLHEHRAGALKDVVAAENEVAQSQAALEQAEAGLQSARFRIEGLGLNPETPTREVAVRAPISGKVLEIAVAPGEYRNDANAPLMTVADLSTVWIASEVPENYIRLITPGEHIRIDLAAYPGEVFHGRVRRIADTVDPQTRAVKVHAELDNRAGRFRPEMFGRIRHSHGTRQAPAVPANAVLQTGGSPTVFVERAPGRFAPVAVVTGESRGGMVPILSGLNAGARVVVDGAILLGGR
ncbi:MAG: efflux RND transporter periplasmic adaptor subunit [Bryobacteraceae bacterium]